MPSSLHGAGVAAIVVAAGRGSRTGLRLPKQFLKVGGRTLLEHAVGRLASHPRIDEIVAVVPATRVASVSRTLRRVARSCSVVRGGARRQDSVRRGLEALSHRRAGIVLVHDAARPIVPRSVIDAVIGSAVRYGSGVPGLAPPDTVKEVSRGGRVRRTLRREALRLVQTPQAFRIAWLRSAFERLGARSAAVTDDAALVEAAGYEVRVVEGSPLNFKVTSREDVARLRSLLAG